MLNTFGSYMCLIDSTYNTSVYDLPLFALAVKTNVGFTYVVTSLIVNETTASFVDILTRVRQSNPSWNPAAFVTDFNEAQINALTTVFPGFFSMKLHLLNNVAKWYHIISMIIIQVKCKLIICRTIVYYKLSKRQMHF